MNDTKSKNLHSDQVQDILGDIPGRLLRWGTTLIFCLLVVLLVLSWFFKFPDIITAPVTINMEQSPAIIKARSTGKIIALMVKNQEQVVQGTPLAIIENAASYSDVLWLDSCLHTWNPEIDTPDKGLTLLGDTLLMLGNLQAVFAGFVSTLEEYNRFIQVMYYQQKINLKAEQLRSRKSYYSDLLQQRSLLHAQQKNAEAVYKRDSVLFKKGVNSEETVEASKNNLLKIRQSVSALNGTIKEAEIESTLIRETMLDLEQKQRNELSQFVVAMKSSYLNLTSQMKAWKQEFVLSSPISGTVNLMGNWSLNQNVNNGDIVFTVLPSGLTEPVGKAMVPAKGSGKVLPGQIVHVHLSNFPDKEYGFIKGVVGSLSDVPLSDGTYVAEIVFPDGLKTTYGVSIPVSGTLTGYADVVTEEIRLLKRIVMPVKRIINRQLH
jgi:biotin carboxyl carrier protein